MRISNEFQFSLLMKPAIQPQSKFKRSKAGRQLNQFPPFNSICWIGLMNWSEINQSPTTNELNWAEIRFIKQSSNPFSLKSIQQFKQINSLKFTSGSELKFINWLNADWIEWLKWINWMIGGLFASLIEFQLISFQLLEFNSLHSCFISLLMLVWNPALSFFSCFQFHLCLINRTEGRIDCRINCEVNLTISEVKLWTSEIRK